MKYRMKPVVIEAVQWFKDGDHCAVQKKSRFEVEAILDEFNCKDCCSACGKRIAEHGDILYDDADSKTVCPGDWIITGVDGKHYPCKPDIFEATYEAEESAGDEWEEQRNWQEQQQADREPE